MPTNFQGSINQALGVAGVLAGISGIPQERREAAKIDKLRESAKSQRDTIVSTLDKAPSDSPEYAGAKETAQYFDEKLGEATRAKYEARPTEKNAQELLKENIKAQRNKGILSRGEQRKVEREGAQARLDEEEAAYQDYLDERAAAYQDYLDEESWYVPNDEARAEQANKRAATQQKTRKKRRDFIRDYLSQMQTNMGGKVGDMPTDIQKIIAANYSPKERQRIMNQQDKEKGGKK